MILIKIKKSCHESCHEIAKPLISQGFWNLVLWVQVPSPALIHLLGSLENSGLRASFMFELMLFGVRPILLVHSKVHIYLASSSFEHSYNIFHSSQLSVPIIVLFQ